MAEWDKEHRDRAIQLAKEGWSGSHVSAILFHEFGIRKTRNACIGIAHRNGVSVGGGQATKRHGGQYAAKVARAKRLYNKSKKQRRPSRYGAPPSPVYAIIHDGLPLPPPSQTDIARISFEDAEAHHCHWIPAHIDPKLTPQNKPLYCGEKTAAGTDYCRDHLKRLHGAPEIPPPKPKAPARRPTFYEQMEEVA
jgi:hypothetical protein